MSHALEVHIGDPAETFYVIHDGGWPLGGDVTISLDPEHVEKFADHARVTVPFRVLAAAVADAVRSRRIGDLESQEDYDLLGLRGNDLRHD